MADDATWSNPDGEQCHITIRYEIIPDTLLPVNTSTTATARNTDIHKSSGNLPG